MIRDTRHRRVGRGQILFADALLALSVIFAIGAPILLWTGVIWGNVEILSAVLLTPLALMIAFVQSILAIELRHF